jgi:hypothetical protein
MEQSTKLRNLANWYRDFAEKAGEPWIWEARIRQAQELEREADLLAEDTDEGGITICLSRDRS